MKNRRRAYLIIFIFSAFLITSAIDQSILSSALPSPTYLTPANGSYTNSNSITFTWAAVSGATDYDIEYGLNPSFLPGIDFNVPASQLNYTIVDYSSEGDLYWRVRTNAGPVEGDWDLCPIWMLTVDRTPPGQATLLSPTNGSYINDSTPLFDWSSASGGRDYNLLADDDSTFDSPLVNITTTSTLYQTITPLPMTYYYWKVQSTDRAGNVGPWSETFQFYLDLVAPGPIALYSPSNNTYTDDVWAFECYTDPGADLYYFEFGNNPAFDTIYASGESAINAYDPVLPDGVIYWHAQARDFAGNQGPWSETWMLTLDSTGPAAPILVTPTNNSYTSDTTPLFEWTEVEPAVEWRLSVSYSPIFSSSALYDTTNTWYDTITPRHEDPVYWRVRGRDSLWNYGPWSETGVINVDLTEPIAPSIIGPFNNSATNDSIVTFEWEYLVDTIDYYEIEVSQYDDFSIIYYHPTINDSNSHVSTGPFADAVYYWRIRAIDLAGNVGNWTETWTYEVDTIPPGIVTLVSPANGAVIGTSTPTFTWDPVAGAVLYRLILVFNNDWSSPITIVDLSETTYLLPFAVGGAANVFYWNVRAIDAAGNIGDFDPAWTFTIAIVPELGSNIPLYIIATLLTGTVILQTVIKRKKRK